MDENVTDLKESINELKEEFRSKCKIDENLITALRKDVSLASSKITDMKLEMSFMKIQLATMQNDMNDVALLKSVREKFEQVEKELIQAFSAIRSDVKNSRIRCDRFDEKLNALDGKEDLFDEEIKKVYAILDKRTRQFNDYLNCEKGYSSSRYVVNKDKKDDKELDDFMKQESFNPMQIAKINESLERAI